MALRPLDMHTKYAKAAQTPIDTPTKADRVREYKRQLEAYLDAGGEIHTIPYGVSALDMEGISKSHQSESKRLKDKL